MTTASLACWKPFSWPQLIAVGIAMAMAFPRLVWPSEIDCEQANTSVDVAVCGDDTLLIADKKVRGLVQRLSQFDPQAEPHQEEWQEHTRDQCADVDCLSAVYLERIGVLQAAIRMRQASATSGTTFQVPLDADQVTTPKTGASGSSGHYKFLGDEPNPRASQDSSERNEWSKIVLWTVLGIFALTLLVGSSGAAVICVEFSDVFWTMAPYAAAIAGYVVYRMQDPVSDGQSEAQMMIVVATSFLVTLSVIKNFHHAISFNQSILIGFAIGVLRLFVGLFSLVIILGAVWGWSRSDSQDNQPPTPEGLAFTRLLLLVFFGLAIWFYWAIVNGRRVFQARGWLEESA